MPLYEYECTACGHRFEAIQKFADAPLETCPKCGGAVRKLQSAPAFQFKGTGWYITDYAKKDGGGAGKSGSSTGNEGKSDGGGEAGQPTTKGGDKTDKTDKTGKADTATPATSPAAKPKE
jgi:putative FmdB family regulatory protein